MLLLCIALDVEEQPLEGNGLRGLGCTAVAAGEGPPRILDSFLWRTQGDGPGQGTGAAMATAGGLTPAVRFDLLDDSWLDPPSPEADFAPVAEAAVEPAAPTPAESAARPPDVARAAGPGEVVAEPDGVLESFDTWIVAQHAQGQEPVLLTGFAVSRDLAWLTAEYEAARRPHPFSSTPLDLRSLALGVLALPWEETQAALVARELGISADEGAGVDELESETRLGAQILVRLLDRVRRRAASAATSR